MAIARLLNEIFAPAITATWSFLMLSLYNTSELTRGMVCWLVGSSFGIFIPMALVFIGVRRGRWTNHHLPQRRDRLVPAAFGTVSSLAGVPLLTVAGAPTVLLVLYVCAILVAVTSTLITLWWKTSAHTAVFAGASMSLILTVNWLFVVLLIVVIPIGWARTKVEDHTPLQTAVGALTGIAVTYFGFIALM